MKKILLILITGLLWCNVGMASEAGGVREPGHDQKCFEKFEKKKIFKRVKMRHKMGWRLPSLVYVKSCVNKSTTNEYNESSRDEAERLVKEFFTATLLK